MSDESPPPYSVAVASPLTTPDPPFSAAALPFSHSDGLAARIMALVSEGQMLDSRFKDLRDVASAVSNFEYQEHILSLCQRFETLLWGSRNLAGIVLVAIKDFNEVILDFLSEPDVAAKDRLKELVNATNLLRNERGSVADQKSSFNSLVRELEESYRSIHPQLGIANSKRRKKSHSGGEAGGSSTQSSRKSKPFFVVPRSEPLSGLSTVATSLGTISRTCMDYALQFERMAEKAVFPSCVVGLSPEAPARVPSPRTAPQNPQERKRFCAPIERGLPALPGLVDALVRDLRAFTGRVDIFDTLLAELARSQDIFVVYLKDGLSVSNQGYKNEINRLRRHLPRVCNALGAYSKARSS